MVVHIAREQNRRPNRKDLEHVIKRNFSGLQEDEFDPVRIIMGQAMPEYYRVKIINIYICEKRSTTPELNFCFLELLVQSFKENVNSIKEVNRMNDTVTSGVSHSHSAQNNIRKEQFLCSL